MKNFFVQSFLLLFLAGAAFAGDYVVGGGDSLRVSVWGVPELSTEVIVRPDGKITLPAVGDTPASGLTPSELGERLVEALEDFVKKPIVTVTVSGITNNKVYVSGGGVPSQVINLPARSSLFKVLCSIGGLANADLRRAYLIRDGKKLGTDFHKLFVDGDFSEDMELRAEDILFLPTNELNKVYVLGAVKDPKYIFYREGMKILDAILETGGFTEFAKENGVEILRTSGEKVEVKVKDLMKGKDVAQNIALNPGDYVTVAEGMF